MRIGVFGAGRMGAYRAGVLARHPQVDEVLLGNRSLQRAEAVASAVGRVKALPLEALYEEPMDAAIVALASSEHLGALQRLLPRGLPVLCEKPLGTTLAETDAVVALARTHGSRLQVGFQRRFDPAFQAARELISSGGLGALYSMAMVAFDHVVTPEEFIPGSGGIFRDLHVHDFDIAAWLTGRRIETVSAYATVRLHERFARYGDFDCSTVLAVMDDGLPVTIRGARHDPLGHDVRMEILGSLDAVTVGWSSATPVRPLEGGGAPRNPWLGFLERFDDAFRSELNAFVQFAAGEAPNGCPPEASRDALQVALACERSLASGEVVKVETVCEP